MKKTLKLLNIPRVLAGYGFILLGYLCAEVAHKLGSIGAYLSDLEDYWTRTDKKAADVWQKVLEEDKKAQEENHYD